MKRLLLFSAPVFTFFCMVGGGTPEEKKQTEKNVVKDVYDTEVSLVDPVASELFAAGADAFEANCITCHSLRYIQMQPDFPEETWQKIVDKMIKSYGAPIPDSTSKAIVKYLVAIKGKKES